MALFRCDDRFHRYPGQQQTMYPAVVNGTVAWRRKLRLCPEHFTLRLEYLELNAQNAKGDLAELETSSCVLCHNEAPGAETQFFVTVYAKGQERVDYFAVVHSECRDALREDWHLTTHTAV